MPSGIAGGKDKCAYVTGELGFDACIDHRDPAMPSLLAEACPNGIDVYFENVNGAVWGRGVPVAQSVRPDSGLRPRRQLQHDGAAVRSRSDAATVPRDAEQAAAHPGLLVYDFGDQEPDFLREIGPLVKDGTIKHREDVTDGLENAPRAFIGLLGGGNFGKTLVRVGH